jgi:hypothetical protein
MTGDEEGRSHTAGRGGGWMVVGRGRWQARRLGGAPGRPARGPVGAVCIAWIMIYSWRKEAAQSRLWELRQRGLVVESLRSRARPVRRQPGRARPTFSPASAASLEQRQPTRRPSPTPITQPSSPSLVRLSVAVSFRSRRVPQELMPAVCPALYFPPIMADINAVAKQFTGARFPLLDLRRLKLQSLFACFQAPAG